MPTSSQDDTRKYIRKVRRDLDDEYRDRASIDIQLRLLRSNFFYASKHIACYISMPDEVDTSMVFDRAWRAGKSIYAPVVDEHRQLRFVRVLRKTRLKKSQFGLWEPVCGEEIPPKKLDVVVTPLVAINRQLHRIGMGGGYYDSTFSFLNHNRSWLRPKLIGLAFECQKVEKITPNPWDIRLYRFFSNAN
ncbi:MAG: 5-formyltetrahydrofolate cyclo-ligase [Woeseiaceae bacterium]|nr:5-formyltetrahydrofolate cyclo-ligase [Woeseiaceae bacterium]